MTIKCFKAIFLILLLSCFAIPLYSQDENSEAVLETETADTTDEAVPADSGSEADNSNKDESIGLIEERLETLKYGIDSEVLAMIDTFVEEKFSSLDSELSNLLFSTDSHTIRHKLIDYFKNTDNDVAADHCGSIVSSVDSYDRVSIIKSLEYLAHFKNDTYIDAISDLTDDANKEFKNKAIWTIGKLQASEFYEDFKVLWEDEDQDQSMRTTLLQSIADMGVEESIEFFAEIVEDEDADSTEKKIAISALGSIGTEEALKGLIPLLESEEIFLRLESTRALEDITNSESTRLLIRALRDNFWRIRVTAIAALAERGAIEAGPNILYKAKKDPENRVQIDAMKALAKMGYTEGLDYLRSVLGDEKRSDSMRQIAAELLIENDYAASIDTINTVIEERWEKEEDKLLDIICRNIAVKENSISSAIYEKLLDHEYFIIKIYGLRGIRINRLTEFKERVQSFIDEPPHPQVKKVAESTIKEL